MVIYSKNEALICKIFPSSLGPITIRWFDGLGKWSIQRYDELIRAFGMRFVTCSRTLKLFASLLTMAMKEGKLLKPIRIVTGSYTTRLGEITEELQPVLLKWGSLLILI